MSYHSDEIGGYANDAERCAECGRVYEGPRCTCTPRPKPLNPFDAFLTRCVLDCVEANHEPRGVTCADCDGEGWWEVGEPIRRMGEDGQVIQRRRQDCPYCGGSGKR